MTTQKPRYVKPLPQIDPESEPFWKGCKEHRLEVQRCKKCSQFYFYPRARCPFCFTNEVEWVKCSGKGKVHTFTIIRQSAMPGFRDEAPYVVAVVELDEGGVQMLTNLVQADVTKVKIGMPVQVHFEDATEEITLPKFRPA